MEIRVGQGYDIHKLIKGKKKHVVIGNYCIPFNRCFKAHSDGDVLIHSIIDSLLGAANLGDIGTHFPDNDPKYKDMDSSILLSHTVELLTTNEYEIVNVDSTVICEKPKMKDHIPSIKKRLSEVMKISADLISIKAKTKEKLDSVGRGKAIEVFSVCLIKKVKR